MQGGCAGLQVDWPGENGLPNWAGVRFPFNLKVKHKDTAANRAAPLRPCACMRRLKRGANLAESPPVAVTAAAGIMMSRLGVTSNRHTGYLGVAWACGWRRAGIQPADSHLGVGK